MTAFVAVLTIHLHFPLAGSLKGKRKELAPVKAHLHGRCGAAVAEVEHQDLWQRATLAAALVSSSTGHLQETADGIERWLHSRFPDGVMIERRLLSEDDLRD